jgi:hypothetical protein
MEPIDFVMIYPCYSPMFAVGSPLVTTASSIDGLKVAAVVLFTDSDLNREFIQANKMSGIQGRLAFQDAISLAAYLKTCLGYDDIIDGPKVTHVMIDPGHPSRLVRIHPIPDFVAHILAES